MIQRKLYHLLLRLHPASFRDRFAQEMLWVFDQTLGEAGFLRLLADVALSLVKQRMALDTPPQCKGGLFQRTPEDRFHAAYILQAGAIASIALVGFLALVQQTVPLPQPPKHLAIRSYRPDICSERNVVSRTFEHRQRVP